MCALAHKILLQYGHTRPLYALRPEAKVRMRAIMVCQGSLKSSVNLLLMLIRFSLITGFGERELLYIINFYNVHLL